MARLKITSDGFKTRVTVDGVEVQDVSEVRWVHEMFGGRLATATIEVQGVEVDVEVAAHVAGRS